MSTEDIDKEQVQLANTSISIHELPSQQFDSSSEGRTLFTHYR